MKEVSSEMSPSVAPLLTLSVPLPSLTPKGSSHCHTLAQQGGSWAEDTGTSLSYLPADAHTGATAGQPLWTQSEVGRKDGELGADGSSRSIFLGSRSQHRAGSPGSH